MNLFKFFVARPVLVSMIFLAVLGAGLFGIYNLKVDLLPVVNLPIISVTVINPGTSPQDMEDLITKKLEKAFSDMGELKQITSWSSDSVTNILVEFNYGKKDIDIAAIEVARKINEVRSDLPASIEEPLIVKMDPATRPIITLALNGESFNPRDLREFAENNVKTRLERVNNVAAVNVSGGQIRQININLDKHKMAFYSVDVMEVISVLKSKNMNIPAGNISAVGENSEYLVKSFGQFENIDKIKKTVVKTLGNRPVNLEEIAEITDSYKEERGYASLNARPAVIMDLKKQTGTNTVEIAKAVREEVEKIKKELPQGMELIIARDDSEFINKSISGITDTAWQGFLLAFFVVLFLIGSFKPAFIIFISVPVSVISAFFIMYAGKMSINMVSLYALTISIGVNFDNSIIVLENIIRHLSKGKDRLEAASVGVSELAAPLFASTLTNVVVFIPLAMMTGYIGELMKTMAFTAIFAQTVALPVALFFTSTITPRIVTKKPEKVTNIPVFSFIISKVIDLLEKTKIQYRKSLETALNNSKKVLISVFIIFLMSFGLVPLIGIEFMPRTDQNSYFIDIETPVGSTLEFTKKVASQVEKIILENSEVEYVVTTIGGDEQTSPPVNKIGIALKLISRLDRKKTAIDSGNVKKDLITGLRKTILSQVAGIAHIQFVQPAPWWGSAGAPVEIKLSGNDWELLNQIADTYVEKLSEIPGLFDVSKNIRDNIPAYKLKIDEEKISQLGLNYAEIAMKLRTLTYGGVTWDMRTEFRNNSLFRDKNIYIITTLDKNHRENIEDILNVNFVTAYGNIPLKTFVSVEKGFESNFITKENKTRRIIVSAQTSDEPLNTLIFGKTLPVLNTIKLPAGIDMKIEGEVTRMNDQVSGMTIGFIFAAIFVYMVLAGQFESFKQPFIMMLSIPLQMIGVFIALFITGNTLNTTSGNGIIALVGVVVNASIVLIDYINLLRSRGLTLREAILTSGETRFRPILMTVATTMFAMIPMALSQAEGSDIYKPLAIAFIGGLLSSTVMTLYIIPVLYNVFEGGKDE